VGTEAPIAPRAEELALRRRALHRYRALSEGVETLLERLDADDC
jgi:hypothetical protein